MTGYIQIHNLSQELQDLINSGSASQTIVFENGVNFDTPYTDDKFNKAGFTFSVFDYVEGSTPNPKYQQISTSKIQLLTFNNGDTTNVFQRATSVDDDGKIIGQYHRKLDGNSELGTFYIYSGNAPFDDAIVRAINGIAPEPNSGGNVVLPNASDTVSGLVKVDDVTVKVDADGKISAIFDSLVKSVGNRLPDIDGNVIDSFRRGETIRITDEWNSPKFGNGYTFALGTVHQDAEFDSYILNRPSYNQLTVGSYIITKTLIDNHNSAVDIGYQEIVELDKSTYDVIGVYSRTTDITGQKWGELYKISGRHSIESVNGISPTQYDSNITLPMSDDVLLDDSNTFASSKSVKTVKDELNSHEDKLASDVEVGHVKVDGTTISADSDGTISAIFDNLVKSVGGRHPDVNGNVIDSFNYHNNIHIMDNADSPKFTNNAFTYGVGTISDNPATREYLTKPGYDKLTLGSFITTKTYAFMSSSFSLALQEIVELSMEDFSVRGYYVRHLESNSHEWGPLFNVSGGSASGGSKLVKTQYNLIVESENQQEFTMPSGVNPDTSTDLLFYQTVYVHGDEYKIEKVGTEYKLKFNNPVINNVDDVYHLVLLTGGGEDGTHHNINYKLESITKRETIGAGEDEVIAQLGEDFHTDYVWSVYDSGLRLFDDEGDVSVDEVNKTVKFTFHNRGGSHTSKITFVGERAVPII